MRSGRAAGLLTAGGFGVEREDDVFVGALLPGRDEVEHLPCSCLKSCGLASSPLRPSHGLRIRDGPRLFFEAATGYALLRPDGAPVAPLLDGRIE